MNRASKSSSSTSSRIATLGDIGAAVRDRRRAAGLTQEDAAHLCGVSVPFMNQLERGSRPGLSITRVLQVCSQLGLTITIAAADARFHLAEDPAKRSPDA